MVATLRGNFQDFGPETLPCCPPLFAESVVSDFQRLQENVVKFGNLLLGNHFLEQRPLFVVETEAILPVLNEEFAEQEVHHGCVLVLVLATSHVLQSLPVISLRQKPCFRFRKNGRGCSANQVQYLTLTRH